MLVYKPFSETQESYCWLYIPGYPVQIPSYTPWYTIKMRKQIFWNHQTPISKIPPKKNHEVRLRHRARSLRSDPFGHIRVPQTPATRFTVPFTVPASKVPAAAWPCIFFSPDLMVLREIQVEIQIESIRFTWIYRFNKDVDLWFLDFNEL